MAPQFPDSLLAVALIPRFFPGTQQVETGMAWTGQGTAEGQGTVGAADDAREKLERLLAPQALIGQQAAGNSSWNGIS